MKVLELCLSPSFGGLELYVCRAVAALTLAHSVVAVAAAGSPIGARLQGEGCALRTLRATLRRLPLLAAARLARIIDEESVDVVHVNWGPDLTLAALAKRLSRRRPRLVYTRHMLMNRSKRDFYHQIVYSQFDCVIAITRDMEKGLLQHLPREYAHRVRQLYCGVPAPAHWLTPTARAAQRAEWDIPPQAFVAGVLSRLEEAKGQHLLIEAIAQLHSEGRTAYGLIVGHSMDEAYRKRLRNAVRAHGLEPYIRFLGFADQPQVLVQACDCLTLPTHCETFANIVSEAMRAEVAVIASDRGGMPEMIEHGVSGLLFRSGDAAHLAAQLRLLYDEPTRRTELAQVGRERADQLFSIERRFPQLIELFEELLGSDTRRDHAVRE